MRQVKEDWKKSVEIIQRELDRKAARALLICIVPLDQSGAVAMNMATTLTQLAANDSYAFRAAINNPTYSQYCSSAHGEILRSDIASSGVIVASSGLANYAFSSQGVSAICFKEQFLKKLIVN